MANDAGPEAKQWALAATAILTTMTRRQPRHDRLGGAEKTPETEGTAKTILANSWGVDGRDKLVATLEGLGGGGHSAEYQKAAAAFAQAPPQQRQQDPKLAFVGQFGTEIGNRGLLAWDLGRLLAVAGWGYLAGYCTEDEAWGASLSAGARLRGTYASWDEYGKHYRLGALFWDPTATQQIDPILAGLASAPDSPWRAVAWNLGAAPGPGASGGVMGASPAAPAAPSYGGVPVVGAPPGGAAGAAPGAPPGYGAPPVAPPAPGTPGAPQSYGGVPVIAPTPGGGGGAPPGYGGGAALAGPPGYGGGPSGGPGAPGGGSKKGLIIGAAAAGVVGLILIVGLAVHFLHHESHEGPHESHERHGRH